MDRSAVERTVLEVVGGSLKCEVGPETSRRNTSQWDSLKHIEIILAVEDELEVEFTETEMAEADSVAKIVAAAMARYEA